MKCLMVTIAPGKSLLFAFVTKFTTCPSIFFKTHSGYIAGKLKPLFCLQLVIKSETKS